MFIIYERRPLLTEYVISVKALQVALAAAERKDLTGPYGEVKGVAGDR
jgi:hypothetical protein